MNKYTFILSLLLILIYYFGVIKSQSIYERYEKKNHVKNYVEIVEIFRTHQEPPEDKMNEKELNGFLAKDSFRRNSIENRHNQFKTIKGNPKENINPDYKNIF